MHSKGKRDPLLDKYYRLCKSSKWKEAKETMLELIRRDSPSPWLYTSLSSCYYELREYKKALYYSEKAYKMNRRDPLILWDYAGTLIMLNREIHAIALLKKITGSSVHEIGFVNTTEGKRWAESILNDSYYKIGIAYHRLQKLVLAEKYFRKHLFGRKSGLPSLYSKKEAEFYLKPGG